MRKSISVYNIVCFAPRNSSAVEWIQNPHIIGFNHSHPDEPAAFTQCPDRSSEHKEYQHPSYIESKERYRPEYDYYSLGIVLLEIGLWKSFAEMIPPMDIGGREAFLEKRMPILGHSMGVKFCDAVRACLDWKSEEGPAQTSTSRYLDFERLVID